MPHAVSYQAFQGFAATVTERAGLLLARAGAGFYRGLTGFYRFLPRVFPGMTGLLYQLLPSLQGFAGVSRGSYLGFTRLYRPLPGFTVSYRVLPGFTGSYRVLPVVTWFYDVSGFYRGSPGFTAGLSGFAGSYRVLPGFI